jgi:hypothetical protein
LNLVAWSWLRGDERYLIIVNLSDRPAQSLVRVPWANEGGGQWHLLDAMSGAIYERAGDEMRSPGLYVELDPWKYHFFEYLRVNKT